MIAGLLRLIVVGFVAGWVAGRLMKGSHGPLMDIVIGIAGAVIGGWIFRLAGLFPGYGLIPEIIVAIVGAVVLVWLVRMLKKA